MSRVETFVERPSDAARREAELRKEIQDLRLAVTKLEGKVNGQQIELDSVKQSASGGRFRNGG